MQSLIGLNTQNRPKGLCYGDTLFFKLGTRCYDKA